MNDRQLQLISSFQREAARLYDHARLERLKCLRIQREGGLWRDWYDAREAAQYFSARARFLSSQERAIRGVVE